MNSLSMVEAKLPPGFRFHPRDDELVCDYLMKKWNGCEYAFLVDVDLNKCEPWDLPEIACVGGKEWYFYSQRDKKYATGLRTNRATKSGYWKATGKDRQIVRKGSLVGMRKTLVFYRGRAPKGNKTDWVMHEFRVESTFAPPNISISKEDWVLCRVFYKNRDQVPSKITRNESNNSNTNNHDIEICSTSLPPLMESYLSFDQTTPNINTNYQQVPCFSMHSSSSTIQNNHNILNPTLSRTFHENPNITTKGPTFGANVMPPNNALNISMPSFPCDEKMIEVVLSHLTKMDSSSTNLGEVASYDNFDVALPTNMWSHY